MSDGDTNLRKNALELKTNMLNCENQKNERHDDEDLNKGEFDIPSNKEIYDKKVDKLLDDSSCMLLFSGCVKKILKMKTQGVRQSKL